jgi:hypothetical protein
MLDLEKLRKQAVDDCLAHVQKELEGQFHVEPIPEPPEECLSWDPALLRYAFDVGMDIGWRYGQFEVVLDAEDRVVGFVDHDKWLDCRWEPLTDEEALRIARSSGLLRQSVRKAESRQGEKGCLEMVLEVLGGKQPERMLVRINPARRAVISLLPEAAEAV